VRIESDASNTGFSVSAPLPLPPYNAITHITTNPSNTKT
jgi:ribosomal protein S10